MTREQMMLRKGMWLAGAMVATWASLGAPSAVAKRSSHVLPAGTPYAAETRAKILGTVDLTYSDDSVTYLVCEWQSSEYKINEGYTVYWAANYPHVTVPVADKQELGRAAKKLHVDAQPTSNGTGGIFNSDYDISGSEPPTQAGNQAAGGSDCTSVPYSGTGEFRGVGKPSFELRDYKDPWGGQQLYVFVMSAMSASPATYVDGTGDSDDVFDTWLDAYDKVPAPSDLLYKLPDWNTVPADFPINVLKKLVHQKQVQLKVPTYAGTNNCSATGLDGTGTDTCSVTWKFSWTVTLTRTHLYRTVRAYRR